MLALAGKLHLRSILSLQIEKAARFSINISKMLTLRPPFFVGNLEMYMAVKNLSHKKSDSPHKDSGIFYKVLSSKNV